MRHPRRFICTYESERLSNREQRRRARQELHRGIEPLPQYRTGKLWTD